MAEDSKKTSLLGFTRVTITNPDGQEESVLVNQVKASQIFEFQKISFDEARVVEFLTEKSMDWIDALSLKYPKEYGKLAETCLEANKDFFSSYLQRSRERLKILSGISNQGL